MALFKRLFSRKPPDRLLEISERVYVFDCCIATEALQEDKYKAYMGHIMAQLQNYYLDSAFMVCNFREGDNRTYISEILSLYYTKVLEYPQQYEGCPMLPLRMIYHFLLYSETWLSQASPQNVLLFHCEMGGWPMLAFMLAAFLLYRKKYKGEKKTLEMVYKKAPMELRHFLTPINPQPSQLRYLQYISWMDINLRWPSSDTPLQLERIILRALPLFGKKGCQPVVRIYGLDSSSTTCSIRSRLLFSSSKTEENVRYYQQEECEVVEIDIHERVQGDVVLECLHSDDPREAMMFFRIMFHTTFVQGNVLICSRDEVDVRWVAKDQMPKDFQAEVIFTDTDALSFISTTVGEFGDDDEPPPFPFSSPSSPPSPPPLLPPPPPPLPPPLPNYITAEPTPSAWDYSFLTGDFEDDDPSPQLPPSPLLNFITAEPTPPSRDYFFRTKGELKDGCGRVTTSPAA